MMIIYAYILISHVICYVKGKTLFSIPLPPSKVLNISTMIGEWLGAVGQVLFSSHCRSNPPQTR